MNKLISIVVPTYNEEENIPLLIPEIRKEMSENLPEYDYEILFIDNCSFDRTQAIIEEFCVQDTRIKAIFNARNFGQSNSPFHGLTIPSSSGGYYSTPKMRKKAAVCPRRLY